MYEIIILYLVVGCVCYLACRRFLNEEMRSSCFWAVFGVLFWVIWVYRGTVDFIKEKF